MPRVWARQVAESTIFPLPIVRRFTVLQYVASHDSKETILVRRSPITLMCEDVQSTSLSFSSDITTCNAAAFPAGMPYTCSHRTTAPRASSSFFNSTSFKSPGFANPLDAFMTCLQAALQGICSGHAGWQLGMQGHSQSQRVAHPAKNPCNFVFPPQNCSSCLGFAASTSSTITSSAPTSDIWASPFSSRYALMPP